MSAEAAVHEEADACADCLRAAQLRQQLGEDDGSWRPSVVFSPTSPKKRRQHVTDSQNADPFCVVFRNELRWSGAQSRLRAKLVNGQNGIAFGTVKPVVRTALVRLLQEVGNVEEHAIGQPCDAWCLAFQALGWGEHFHPWVLEEHATEYTSPLLQRPLVYLAHPVSGDYENNIARARRWLAWANRQGVVAIAPWLANVEKRDDDPLWRAAKLDECKRAVIACDQIWLVGGTIAPGMAVELEGAREAGIQIVDLTATLGPEPPV